MYNMSRINKKAQIFKNVCRSCVMKFIRFLLMPKSVKLSVFWMEFGDFLNFIQRSRLCKLLDI